MFINVDKTGSVEAFKTNIESLTANEAVKGLLILACDENGFTPETIDPLLTSLTIPVMGGVFPQIIHGAENLSRGTILAGLTTAPNVQFIPGLTDPSVEYETLIDEKFPDIGDAQTMYVFVDGLGNRIVDLLDSLFNIFGLELNYVGGGAGSLSFVQRPCLFTNDGLKEDGAVLALANTASGVGVGHGWESIRGPFKVTESHQNVLKTLDWQPAFVVYRQVVEEVSGKTFTADNFFDISKGYPFGINKVGSEKIVRDPIAKGENDTIMMVEGIPQESFVDILTGDNQSLVSAAQRAYQQGKDSFPGSAQESWTFFIDCISRVLFMEDEFGKELSAVHEADIPLIGALTLGEIANSGDDYLEFYNKTAVIAVLES
ncbi:MAG: FIST N-terminal domain-containing protein [Chloroflexota bacterium]